MPPYAGAADEVVAPQWSLAGTRASLAARWLPLALALLCGTAVALPQLVELLRILPTSMRGVRGYDAVASTVASWDPRQAIEQLLPLPFGRVDRSGSGGFWGQRFHTGMLPLFITLYPGLLPLVLAAAAGRARGRGGAFAWSSLLIGVFVALGRFNPAMAALRGAARRRHRALPDQGVAAGGDRVVGAGGDRLAARRDRGRRRGAAPAARGGARPRLPAARRRGRGVGGEHAAAGVDGERGAARRTSRADRGRGAPLGAHRGGARGARRRARLAARDASGRGGVGAPRRRAAAAARTRHDDARPRGAVRARAGVRVVAARGHASRARRRQPALRPVGSPRGAARRGTLAVAAGRGERDAARGRTARLALRAVGLARGARLVPDPARPRSGQAARRRGPCAAAARVGCRGAAARAAARRRRERRAAGGDGAGSVSADLPLPIDGATPEVRRVAGVRVAADPRAATAALLDPRFDPRGEVVLPAGHAPAPPGAGAARLLRDEDEMLDGRERRRPPRLGRRATGLAAALAGERRRSAGRDHAR